MLIHRLTVDGKDYFPPDPVTDLKSKILEAVKSGVVYVNIPPARQGPGVDILFSPGMPIVWTQIDVGTDGEDDNSDSASVDIDQYETL